MHEKIWGKTWKRGKIFAINFKRILSKGLAINIHKYLSKEQPEGKRQWVSTDDEVKGRERGKQTKQAEMVTVNNICI